MSMDLDSQHFGEPGEEGSPKAKKKEESKEQAMTDKYTFEDALKAQEALQKDAYGLSPRSMDDDQTIAFISWNILALEDELHEALGEIGWKPWAASNHINRDAYRGELVDAFHFFMNLMLATEIDVDELLTAYQNKREKNLKRQQEGYDGVSTKCKICHRALDDDAVECVLWDDGTGYCAAADVKY